MSSVSEFSPLLGSPWRNHSPPPWRPRADVTIQKHFTFLNGAFDTLTCCTVSASPQTRSEPRYASFYFNSGKVREFLVVKSPAKKHSTVILDSRLTMVDSAIFAAAVRGSALPEACHDDPGCSPPPYPQSDRQFPPQYVVQVSEPTGDPPEYNYYDVERGSFIDRALAQYAQSISPTAGANGYSILELDEDDPRPASPLCDHLRNFLFCCIAVFCGATWALLWICAIGYGIVLSLRKIAEGLL